ncbi:MAG: hypothetical protein ACE365_07900 [Gammaproteobacteria bacterium]
MSTLKIFPTETAHWYSVICEAEIAAERALTESLEQYLVMLMMRFSRRPEVVHDIVALDFLDNLENGGIQMQQNMRDVGDKCLLFSGVFPELHIRRRVKNSYFMEVGRSAYRILSDHLIGKDASLFQDLSYEFNGLVYVLKAIRRDGSLDGQIRQLIGEAGS